MQITSSNKEKTKMKMKCQEEILMQAHFSIHKIERKIYFFDFIV